LSSSSSRYSRGKEAWKEKEEECKEKENARRERKNTRRKEAQHKAREHLFDKCEIIQVNIRQLCKDMKNETDKDLKMDF